MGAAVQLLTAMDCVWDHICGTVWTKDDIEERYEKSRVNADKMMEHEGNITELKLNATATK
jgi:hypothetical protein